MTDKNRTNAKVYAQFLHEKALQEGYQGLSLTTLILTVEEYLAIYNHESKLRQVASDMQEQLSDISKSKTHKTVKRNNLTVVE